MAEFSVEYINPFLMAATSVIKDICQVDMTVCKDNGVCK